MKVEEKISVVIVDDHQIVIDGLLGVFKTVDHINVIGYTTKGMEAIELILEKKPDIVLLDINIPDLDGYEICRGCKKRNVDAKILGLSMYDDMNSIDKLLKAGGAGYIYKNYGKEELINAIETVMSDGRYLDQNTIKLLLSHAEKIDTPLSVITEREKEVLALIAKGKQSSEISERLHISLFTVKTHRKNILTKLSLKNTAELVRYALENGFH